MWVGQGDSPALARCLGNRNWCYSHRFYIGLQFCWNFPIFTRCLYTYFWSPIPLCIILPWRAERLKEPTSWPTRIWPGASSFSLLRVVKTIIRSGGGDGSRSVGMCRIGCKLIEESSRDNRIENTKLTNRSRPDDGSYAMPELGPQDEPEEWFWTWLLHQSIQRRKRRRWQRKSKQRNETKQSADRQKKMHRKWIDV